MTDPWTDERHCALLWEERLNPVRDRFLADLADYFRSAPGGDACLDPFNGGCMIVALALRSVVGGEIVAVVGCGENEDYALHAAVLKNGMLWDFDGPLRPEPFFERYNSFVDEPAYLVAGYRPLNEYDFCEAMESDELTGRLAEILRSVLSDTVDHDASAAAQA